MAITIDSPVDGSSGQPNPIVGRGTASAADYVEGRWERSDGKVFDGEGFFDDATEFRKTAGGSLSTTIDHRQFDRFFQSGDEKFTVEFGVTWGTDGASQYVFSVFGAPGRRLVWVYLSSVGSPTVTIRDDTETNWYVQASVADLGTLTEGDELRYRLRLWRGQITFQGSINGADWVDMTITRDDTTGIADTVTWGHSTGTPADDEMTFTLGALYPGSAANEMLAAGIRYAKVTAHDGATIIDLDLTRDANTGTTTVQFDDAYGNQWDGVNATIHPTREDNWFTAEHITAWSLLSPSQLEPIEHTLVARTNTGGVAGTPVEVSFTPTTVLELGSGGRFARRGTSLYLWAGSVADTNAPTFAEIDASIDITDEVASFDGLDLNHKPVVVPKVTSSQDVAFPGVVDAQTLSVTMYDRENNTATHRHLFGEGSEGYLILCPHGIYDVGDRVTVVPCVSAGNADVWNTSLEGARYVVSLLGSGRVRETVVAA